MNASLAIKLERNFNVLERLTSEFSIFAKENVMKDKVRDEKFSVFNVSHNLSVRFMKVM